MSTYTDNEPRKRGRAKYNRKYYARTAFSRNYNAPWSKTEESLVMRHEIPDRELAELLGRSIGSIQLKRARLKAAGYVDDI